MRQLAQFAHAADQFAEQNAQVVIVFRENKDGADGLKKASQVAQGRFMLLDDPGAEGTPDYSSEGFATYVIDGEGKIRAVLPGVLKTRALSDAVLDELKKL